MPKKTCFLISEIGPAGSPIRNRVDQWRRYIYLPALEAEYEILRADDIAAPGHITLQILDHIVNDDLAIIDYTNLNPNVMYEAAIRHIARKHFIQIAPNNCLPPFDIKDLRSIEYDPTDLKYPEILTAKLIETLKEVQSPDYEPPELTKTKFDLQAITKDPEAFLDMLFERLGVDRKKTISNRNFTISNTSMLIDQMRRGGTAFYNDEGIPCPNCGAINYQYNDHFSVNSVYKLTTTFGVNSSSDQNLTCSVCGTEYRKIHN